MKIAIESTDMICEVGGVTCRVWRGSTAKGTKVELLIPLIRIAVAANYEEWKRELKEITPIEAARKVGIAEPWTDAIDLRRVL